MSKKKNKLNGFFVIDGSLPCEVFSQKNMPDIFKDLDELVNQKYINLLPFIQLGDVLFISNEDEKSVALKVTKRTWLAFEGERPELMIECAIDSWDD